MRYRRFHRLVPWLTVFVLLISAIMPVGAAAGRTGSPTVAAAVDSQSSAPTPDDHKRTPLSVSVTLAADPAVGETTTATIVVSSERDAPDTSVEVVVSEGVEIVGQANFQVDLTADESVTLTTDVHVNAAGNHSVSANATFNESNTATWGETGAAYFHSEDGLAVANYVYEGVAASGGAAPGPSNNTDPPEQSFTDGTINAPAVAAANAPAPPAENVAPREEAPNQNADAASASAGLSASPGPIAGPEVASGLLTVSGTTGYTDRTGAWRLQKLLVELLDGSSNHLAWAYSDWDGTYTFPAVNNPGQFRIKAWTYYRHTSMSRGAIRVVTQGNTDGLFTVSGYNYNIGPFSAADGAYNVGSWQPSQSWDGRRAWWIYQDILDAFFFPYYQVPPGESAGSRLPDGGTAEWSSGDNDGTYYNYDHINLADVDAWSPHTVVHEYGHNVMHNVYGLYFPTNDCPSPHYLTGAGGTNCSWTEGFADYYSLIVLNDPVYKWGCAQPCTPPSLDLENHYPGDYWDDGQFVEGNVAGSLWDWTDYNDEGDDVTSPSITPFWQIWNIFWNYNHDRFSQFWATWSAFYNTTNTLASLYYNTIDYGWTSCPDYTLEADETSASASSFPLGTSVNRALCTQGDVDWYYFYGLARYAYKIDTHSLGGGADTTVTLYNSSLSQVAYDDDSAGGLASLLTYVPGTSGYYYVAVRRAGGYGSLSYTYSLRVYQDTPPTVTAPGATIIKPQTMGNPSSGVYTINLKQSWTASDSPEGIASQQAQLQVNGQPFANVSPQPTAGQRTYTTTIRIGQSFRFRVRAFDTLGAYSIYKAKPTVEVKGYQETAPSISYTGTWSNLSNASAWNGQVKQTAGASGTKATFNFTGRRAALVVMTGPNGGKADVFVDGVKRATLDFYSASTTTRRITFVSPALSVAAHTVEVRWRSDKNAASSGKKLYIDGFVVLT
jgi:hypothetical protein